MGSGASKQRHSNQILATPSSSEPSLSKNINITQPKVPVHIYQRRYQRLGHDTVSQSREKEEMNLAQANADWGVLHSDTLQKYKVNYPDQAESLQLMFGGIQALQNFVDSILNQPDQDCTPNDYFNVDEEIQILWILDGLFRTSVNLHRVSAGTSEADQMTTLTDFAVDIEAAETLKRFAQHCFHQYYQLKEEPEEDDIDEESEEYTTYTYKCLWSTLGILQNFSDFHNGFCSACASAGIITMCLENIKRIDAKNSNCRDASRPLLEIIEICIGILHNISRRLRDSELFANSEETLLYFAKIKVPAIAALSLLCLAYLVNEETNHLILADENLLSFIVTLLNEAWQSKDRRSSGLLSAKELAEGLSHLAINDTNKKVLGHKGAVHVLISVLKTSNEDEEKASAARALWMLAFNDNNKEVIRQEKGALETLRQLQHSKDPEVQKAAAGALWELEGKTARESNKTETTGNHVMISYQWDSQDVLIEVKNRLQASGYRVWMDLEQMGGSTLEAMAKAVENASVVLVCVSQRYKESPNCRSEAEYAYQLRKDIIPLMMQRNYKADGWLGMLVGTKLWIDFQSKHVIEAGARKLIKELGGRGRDVDVTDGPSEPVVGAVQADVVARLSSIPAVSGWTNKEVKQWLNEIGLEKVCNEEISEMNGQTLIDLQQLRGECPEYFYRCLEKNLNLRNMFDIFKFRMELGKLLGY